MSDLYDAILRERHVSLPAAYRSMHEAGWLNARSGDYLWVPEAEWMTPEDILAYQPASYHKPGFVPFAFTGGGDHWCWWPQEDPDVVVYCPHDCLEGEYDAPSFLGSLYRRMLAYALGGFEEDEDAEARSHLSEWATRMSAYFQPSWVAALSTLSASPVVRWSDGKARGRGFLSPAEHDTILYRDLAFARMDHTFEWMYR